MTDMLWQPTPDQILDTNMTRFRTQVARDWLIDLPDTAALWQWSVTEIEQFWLSLWRFSEVIADGPGQAVLVDGHKMPGAQFFPEARLNFAENLLRYSHVPANADKDAIVFWGEDKVKRRLSHAELWDRVLRLASHLRSLGLQPGDRVAGFMPNMPETVIGALAASAIGCTWSSCSPDFGVQGVLDRFGQIEPRVLLTADGYWYNGKSHDSLGRVAEFLKGLPTVEQVIVVPYLAGRPDISALPKALLITDALEQQPALGDAESFEFARLPFNHPLYIMYSSGTTGAPKCIVHGAGGTLLQHLKEHKLHGDVKPGDRVFYFTTCGWMMWNWLISGLASGAALMLYDGSPFAPDGNILFDYAQAEKFTLFGTSAKYIDACAKADIQPIRTHDLSSVRMLASTGSPLVPESFDYVYEKVKKDLCLASISGGTDIISCFLLGNPTGPVWRGEIQMRGLGMAVEVWNDEGKPVRGEKGELVCTRPFPAMPIGFWNDPDNKRYKAAYFERYPNIWHHGDYIELTEHGGIIVFGRSDAVLNPGGVRIGTAEIYRQVEQLPEVIESIVIGQDWQHDVRVVLFVRLREGVKLDEQLMAKIKTQIRNNTTPRHVPAKIIQVADIPRTKSGKIVELAVRDIVHGRPIKNKEALANPEALDLYKDLRELQS
ncbi:acetoacetate--CoA ligase [Dongia soli]|uniref:Acetoacetate--CoA ligase n=1 Tax=Dongia soli TaxID=600628 RepID=A0ABU5E5G6_9PROT|nr:acetoacetate--CoA ligase [Dongia soli]MDY0881384.1 acetoacetate--CoA ligase [Dongia soli]